MVYLLHLDPPAGHVRHYAGVTRDEELADRLERGDTSTLQLPILEHVRARGGKILVARTWRLLEIRRAVPVGRVAREKLCRHCSYPSGARTP